MNRFFSSGIPLKKKHGQYFLRERSITDSMIRAVSLNTNSSVFEIGCGDGFLTEAILAQDIARLWVFEIDPQWAEHVREKFPDKRLSLFELDFLQLDFSRFDEHKPWVLLANLPYQITFPILHRLQQHRDILQEGVVMIQEEVAQKILKTYGRGYGYTSLFFQRFFHLRLLDKVPPTAFYPQPKVYSRLLYFMPKIDLEPIPQEDNFWKFIKICFHQPRRTLRNNLAQSHYDLSQVSDETLALRGQQMSMDDLLAVWRLIIGE